ncbi:CdaR family protein [Peptostreptococcus equinus]|uniref:CdaR family protein n=1 Tax=Peptostreptococcus equinus TaxID=3003601 RepID=A0ABY7JMV3_9FIRM|nr:CdaR family protein [Peptostreptococcus sp. CBA3647]WAW14695.1 CdaR family protein [Peptostreptococcus sp. CBA3647]
MEKKIRDKANIKYKVISVVASIALWLYVIAVVDPDDKKVIENVPITITNVSEIEKERYVIYPNKNVTTNVTVSGKLSELQKLNANNVRVYGEVVRPVEGKNIVNLTTNISNRVSRELKDNTYVINLEKKLTKRVPVKIKQNSMPKENIYSIEQSFDEVTVSGPRSLINLVDYVGGSLKLGDKTNSKVNQKVKLLAFDKDGHQVNVDISEKEVEAEVTFYIEKNVPIKIDYDGSQYDAKNLTISPSEVTIKGTKDSIDHISEIKTQNIDDSNIKDFIGKKIKLLIPNSIEIKDSISEVDLNKK